MGIIHLINRIGKSTLAVLRQKVAMNAPRNHVYIFHHIPKCGGSSVIKVLDSWFETVRDYRIGGTMIYPEKVNPDSLQSLHCLCGHFEFDGYHLHQRYPEVFMSDKFRVFTFVRDPLQVQLSLFRYERKNGVSNVKSIEDHLLLRPNYIAHRFPATFDNYREVIDRYFFVGILEEGQTNIDILAAIMGKPSKPLPWVNSTQKGIENNLCAEELSQESQELVARFRSDNALDYLIYDYCVERFKRTLAEQGIVPDGNSAALHCRG